jgi:hypothetical protein
VWFVRTCDMIVLRLKNWKRFVSQSRNVRPNVKLSCRAEPSSPILSIQRAHAETTRPYAVNSSAMLGRRFLSTTANRCFAQPLQDAGCSPILRRRVGSVDTILDVAWLLPHQPTTLGAFIQQACLAHDNSRHLTPF